MSNEVQGEAHGSTPTPVTLSGKLRAIVLTLTGALTVVLREGLEKSTSSVTAWIKAPSTIAGQGTRDCTAADTAYQLTATDTPCSKVYLTGIGVGTIIWGDSGITTAGAEVPLETSARSPLCIHIDNANKIYVASGTLGDDVQFTAMGK